jgi:hypothetical protein
MMMELEAAFESLTKTALKVKRDRDELLDACKDVVNYFWNGAEIGQGRPFLSEGDVHDLVKAAISRAEAPNE